MRFCPIGSHFFSLGFLLLIASCGDANDTSAPWEQEQEQNKHTLQQKLVLPAPSSPDLSPTVTPLEPADMPEVGAVSGPTGLCTGTLVAPGEVITSRSCVLAVTPKDKTEAQRIAMLRFIAPLSRAAGFDAAHVREVQCADGTSPCLTNENEPSAFFRSRDTLVRLILSAPVMENPLAHCSDDLVTTLYNQPTLVMVGHARYERGHNHNFIGPRVQRTEVIQDQSATVIFASRRAQALQTCDFGAALFAQDAGRWVLIGVAQSPSSRDDEAGFVGDWGHLNLGGTKVTRFLRIDAAPAAWQLNRVQKEQFTH